MAQITQDQRDQIMAAFEAQMTVAPKDRNEWVKIDKVRFGGQYQAMTSEKLLAQRDLLRRNEAKERAALAEEVRCAGHTDGRGEIIVTRAMTGMLAHVRTIIEQTKIANSILKIRGDWTE